MKKNIRHIILLPLLCVAVGLSAQDLVILHTNDIHSQMEPMTSSATMGLGGAERRAAYIAQVRKEHSGKVILMDAGDYNQGTPYFNLFGGVMEVQIMNALRYDVTTLGNHEFDNGQKDLAKRLSKARYATVCANYDFSKTPLKRHVKPYTIIKRNGYKIGIIGVTVYLKGVVSQEAVAGLEFENPIPLVNDWADFLKNKKHCDLVICLSHLGYGEGSAERPGDVRLAEQSRNVDIVIGGHSHTFLPEPDMRKNAEGQEVMIVQTGSRGVNVGKIEVNF